MHYVFSQHLKHDCRALLHTLKNIRIYYGIANHFTITHFLHWHSGNQRHWSILSCRHQGINSCSFFGSPIWTLHMKIKRRFVNIINLWKVRFKVVIKPQSVFSSKINASGSICPIKFFVSELPCNPNITNSFVDCR